MADALTGLIGWERALMAAEKVKERLRRATRALDDARVPYAVVGGNAVAEWVGRVDEEAVRTTRDIDLLIRRIDLPAVRATLEAVGFVYHQLLDVDMFLDGSQGRPSGGVHILFAGEKVQPDIEHALPDIDESERAVEFQVATLPSLVKMKLIAWRDKDRTHLRDLIGVGLIDATWPTRFPLPLGERLQQLLDTPNG
ncbi:MAG: nucleotidyl transferase AbiEii/AbiGii toxin family protein [Gemmataceae bacterium]|nr:nucleotidyl transferase AbiEii/AbiGii toxin family protein [Gemmataceae bacterium]